MKRQNFLSTTEYAKKWKISRMQVIRLIRNGKVSAQRVGNRWLIFTPLSGHDPIGLEKTTSLQQWNNLIQAILKKSLKIERSKDRELIYSRLHGLGLPHQRCLAFPIGKFPNKKDFEIAVERLGYPYWISAVPNPNLSHLNRLSKLRLYDLGTGWKFINNLIEKAQYKIIVSQYAESPDFNGTALISPQGRGIAEFISGDRHYIMTRGFTLTDPMIFNQETIKRFSKTISVAKQKKLYRLVRGISGHLEFQHGFLEQKRSIIFFDYNDEEAYLEVDEVWEDLINYFGQRKKGKGILYGLPASPGRAEGRCIVLHHEAAGIYNEVRHGDILISDTTTPEMTPIMEKVKAIITDLGGVTSHAAIVCRELKVPAVVGVGDATTRLRTGNRVIVEASQGKIKIVG